MPNRFAIRLSIALMALFSTGLATITFAQPGTNKQVLLQKSEEFRLKWEENRAKVLEYSRSHNVPVREELPNGRVIEIQLIEDGMPVYYTTDNANAAITTRANQLWPGGLLGLNVSGLGYNKIGEWDAAAPRSTHQEFTNTGSSRVIQKDGVTSLHDHSTHVAGTLIAGGVVATAKGMAYNAVLNAYDWNSDVSEMASAAANGLEISNHSYGYVRGWYWNGATWSWYGNTSVSTSEDYLFGFYNSSSRDWDNVAYNAPYYLPVKSAGNDRLEGPTNGQYPQDGAPDGYDCIGEVGVAKNILTVGAVNDVLNYTGPASVVMSSFSSWGPADDGRIKPDIVANGVGLYSSLAGSNSSYGTYSGTSMATPNAAGTMVLLQQHYQNTHGGSPMRASTLKGLVINTADECGTTTGPDYQFGWGLMNAARAASLITDDATLNTLDELVLNNGGTYTRTVESDGTKPLVVTVSWTDPAGTPVAASLDPITPMLVNDLDLRLIKDGATFYPWKLNRNSPSAAATNNSENNVDNVELVYIGSPAAGTYTIQVDHDGTLANPQYFSLIISGIGQATPQPPVAAFTADKTTIKVGQTVNFTDQSTNSPTSWSWSFPGGTPSTSTAQNPSVTYNSAGTYSVTLTATNSTGSNSLTKTNYITVSALQPPVANFIADKTSIMAGQSVKFTDLSTNNPTSWSWSFPGGTPSSSTAQNPTVTYNTAGTFNVTLTAVNSDGSNTMTKTNYITVSALQPPVADFLADKTTINAGQTVNFTDKSTNNPTSWSWSFPGGTPSSSNTQNPSVIYNTAGTYSVTLTATNSAGSDSEEKVNYITVNPFVPVYCTASSTNCSFEWISKVTIGAFTKSSVALVYSDFTGSIVNFTAGLSYPVTLTPGFSGTKQQEYWRIWIDYNRDGDFADANEQVFVANKKNTLVSGTIGVPATASGSTRMRIAMKRGSAPSYCGTFPYGEVEDYTVTFGAGPVGGGGITDELIGEGSMLIYPNPAGNELNIQLNGFGQRTQLSIFNVLGEKVNNLVITEPNFRQDISALKPGLYFIVVNDGERTASERFIKR